MSRTDTIGAGSPFSLLRRYTQPRLAQERCELCNRALAPEHRHLFETRTRQVACACDGCALAFRNVRDGRFKTIPRSARTLPNFQITDAQWESFTLPFNLAFFSHNTVAGKMTAMYPSPAGATESLLPLPAWEALLNANPRLARMEPDVEAFLVNRAGDARQYYIAPIDHCYELVGLIRMHWRGFSGGDEVWKQIGCFFNRLEERAVPLAGATREVVRA